MKKYGHLFILALVAVVSSCGSHSLSVSSSDFGELSTGERTTLYTLTNSSGAVVYSGQTPTTVYLKSSKSGYFNPEKYIIKASKDGYATGFTTIDYHVSNWYWFGNILFGGLIGWFIVDPITGDMYYLDEVATVNLTPLPKE